MERRFIQTSIDVEERATGGVPTRFTGIASVFYDGAPDTEYVLWDDTAGRAVERIMPNAFDRALLERDDVVATFNHDPNWLLARTNSGTLELAKEQRGLRYRFNFDHTDPQHVALASKIRRGDLQGSSFAFTIEHESWSRENGQDVRSINAVRLHDVSMVTVPAYQASTVGMRSAESVHEARASYAKHQTQLREERAKALKG